MYIVVNNQYYSVDVVYNYITGTYFANTVVKSIKIMGFGISIESALNSLGRRISRNKNSEVL